MKRLGSRDMDGERLQAERTGSERIKSLFLKSRDVSTSLDMTTYGEIFFGNVGRIFATATNPTPIAMRKKEKN